MSNEALLRRAFWYLRHGETDWNRANRTQGSTNIPLNATGVQQAHAAALLLADRGIGIVVCSPLQRAFDTANIVAARLGLALEVHDDLREANFGVHEGEVMGEWFATWVAREVTPQGGESFDAVQARAVAAVNKVLSGQALPLIVGHGGFFRTVRAAMGMTALVRTANGVPAFCSPERDGWKLESVEARPGALPLDPATRMRASHDGA